MASIGRFFSVTRAALALGLVGVSAVLGARSLTQTQSGDLPVGALILAASLLLFGLGMLLTVFPYGCSRCRVKLQESDTTFPVGCYERLNQTLVQGNGPALWELRIEPKDETHFAKLQLEYCPRCQQVGRAQAISQHHDGEFVNTRQQGPRVAVDAEFIATALEVVRKRALL
ncbi:MAG: hypothetical protein KC766_36390 [Myxococcales bacterium]|nr:hypothetical protein [Myxococcales bacterium]